MIRIFASLCIALALTQCAVAEIVDLNDALESITSAELQRHVAALADDTFEGREAGSRGGRAAGLYIVQQLQQYGLPGAAKKSYYQRFGAYSNILAVLEGSDPELKNQYLVVGAHYDHVGYGTRRNSYGPIGYIHNGADDNGSGVSGLLEVAQAFARTGSRPKRSILFCFWDGEEKGLYGSKHWLDHPTVPLEQVSLAFNADMIGRLQKKKLEVLGIRTAPGLRRLVTLANDDPGLALAFNWELKENSDHYPFVQKRIPVVMFHSGLHSDYHRPSDDVEKIDTAGMQQTSRLLFRFLDRAADEPQLGKYRKQAQSETPWMSQVLDRPIAPAPGRLGVTWDEKQATEGKIIVTKISPNSAGAKAGLKLGDRILEFAGLKVGSTLELRTSVLASKNPVELLVDRTGSTEPVKLSLELAGTPVRLGISWRIDAAEPGALIVNRVVPGSPADLAGVRLNDRIYSAASQESLSTESFLSLVAATTGELELQIESSGQPRFAKVMLPAVE